MHGPTNPKNKQREVQQSANFLTNERVCTEKENSAYFGTRFVVKAVPCLADRLVASQLQLAHLLYVTWDHPSGREFENAILLTIIPFFSHEPTPALGSTESAVGWIPRSFRECTAART
jgi:hypothetical protein